ncbi:TonB-dependent receptor [Marivirga sp.]|uniref:TonB-dependent receptor n=1 Tax=Marivirga sp. TaxID=2018662 RepID=UPI002D7E6094|nr:TonB-dependent receptor [Marivirga sp.]HET8861245.1 TonB-dependent receptor [Marivirga sp.]
MTKIILSLTLFTFSTSLLMGQNITLSIKVLDEKNKEELIGATIYIPELSKGTVTDLGGLGIFENIQEGTYGIEISYIGFEKITDTITVSSTLNIFTYYLDESEASLNEVVIQATRSTRTIANIPTRVEFIGGEELEEKAIMNATNISMVLRESTGIQIQQTSLSSGNRSIRIQGLDGRYTQLLRDGFPLYGGFSGGLSIMQIPPLDLAQFEIIKGSASTLYGGGAIAGLVNMVSKSPHEEPSLDILLSQTHVAGSNGNVFYSKRGEKFGVTLYGAGHYHSPYNPDSDNFTNIPKTTTLSINPKIFYYPSKKSTLWLGVNATLDKREGGDIEVVQNEIGGIHQYFEKNESNRISTQAAYELSLSDDQDINIKNSVSFFDRLLTVPGYTFDGNQTNTFTEISYAKRHDKSDWIFGTNLYTNSFVENRDVLPRDQRDITYGIFGNNTTDLSNSLALETGFRGDYSVDWGFFALPRISLLWKVNHKFSTRLGGGLGYKIPDLFTEEAATLHYQDVMPIDKNSLEAEKSYGVNLDFNYRTPLSDNLFLSVNQLFYTTYISNALLLESTPTGQYAYGNAPENIQSLGSETNLKLSFNDFRWFLNYALIDTRLNYLPNSPQKPLTPKHNAGTVLMYENEKWRVGYEIYYTGKQYLSNGIQTSDYTTMGLLIQRHFKWGSPYINFENFTDRRQSRYSPEVTGTIQNPVFQEIYAPTDGFVFTVGILIKPFGGEEDED